MSAGYQVKEAATAPRLLPTHPGALKEKKLPTISLYTKGYSSHHPHCS